MRNPHSLANKFLFLLSFVIVIGSAVSSAFWYFLPVSMAILATRVRHIGTPLIFALALGVAFGTHHFTLGKTGLDDWSLFFLLAWGFCLSFFTGDSIKKWNRRFLYVWAGFILVSAGLFSFQVFQGGMETWTSNELNSLFLPLLFKQTHWTSDLVYFYNDYLVYIFQEMLLGAYWFYFGLILIFNFLVFKMTAISNSKRFRFWEAFSRYRPSDWILAPLVGGLLLLALAASTEGPGSWSGLAFFGWSLTFLSLLPFAVNGLSLVSFLLPRMGSFFAILVLLIFIFMGPPYPLLIIVGAIDIWFDFRRRMRSNPKTEDFQ